MLASLIAFVAPGSGTAVGLPLVGPLVFRARRAAADRARRHAAAGAERRARARMGELCPNGWHAQVTLFGGTEEHQLPRARDGRRCPVALDWADLDGFGAGRR